MIKQVLAILLFTLELSFLFGDKVSPHMRRDGTGTLIFSMIFPTHTDYAPGFTEQKFDQIKVGMDTSEVKEILGMPLMRWQDQWCYTFSYQSKSYKIRQVEIVDGKVKEVMRYFYVD